MQIVREIGKKGQVVIPKDIRDMLGLKAGAKVVFEIEKDRVLLKPEQNPEEFLEEFLNIPKMKHPLTMKEIKKTIEEQYD